MRPVLIHIEVKEQKTHATETEDACRPAVLSAAPGLVRAQLEFKLA